MGSPPPRRPVLRRPVLRRLGFAAAGIVGGLVGLELLARLGLYLGVLAALPSEEMRRFVTSEPLRFDPTYGWMPAPDTAGPPELRFATNALTRLHHASLHPSLRVFTLGDSQTLGAGLTLDQAWPTVAETTLRERGVDVVVVNFAAAGFASGQILELVEREVLPRAPDLILVDARAGDSARLDRHYDDPLLPLRRALFYSRLYRVLRLGVAAARGDPLGPVGALDLDARPPAPHHSGNHALLLELSTLADVPLLFLDYPFVGGPAHALAPASHLPAGAEVIPTTDRLNRSGLSAEALFLDNNHLTVEGSRLVGLAVADHLEARLRARAEAEGLPPLAPGAVGLTAPPVRPGAGGR